MGDTANWTSLRTRAMGAACTLTVLAAACGGSGSPSEASVDTPTTAAVVQPAPVEDIMPSPTPEPDEPTPAAVAEAPETSAPAADPEATEENEPSDPFAVNARLARTVNLGATLEVERGGTWGLPLDASDYVDIAEQGFTAVRIPIRFSDWAATEPPYLIEEQFFERVDAAVVAAEANGLAAIIDLHHYVEIHQDPEANSARLLGLWRQIAERYRELPTDRVAYEVLNEPNTNLTPALWNPLLAEAVAAIREIDPNRTIIVGPTSWYDNLELGSFELPPDNNLIVSFHYYSPFPFTHQGASWIEDSDRWLGIRWDPSADDAGGTIDAEFEAVAQWAQERGVPVFLGEFGVLDTTDPTDRAAWVRHVRAAAEAEGFSWGFWDWASQRMGVQDEETGAWDKALVAALLG